MTSTEADIALIEGLMAFAKTKHSSVIAKRAGVDPGTLQKKLNGQDHNRLSQRTLEKLQAAYPSYPGWTRGGEWMDPKTKDAQGSDIVELEQVDLRYGMGGGYADGPVQIERRAFSREWLRSITSTATRHLVWAIGDGDSMEPTIRAGEIVLIDKTPETSGLNDRIWALTNGDISMIKRVRLQREGMVELLSDNRTVPPETHQRDDITFVGRVIAVVRKL